MFNVHKANLEGTKHVVAWHGNRSIVCLTYPLRLYQSLLEF